MVLTGLLILFVWPARNEPGPPVLVFVSKEPAGIADEQGAKMWLVYFNIRNTNLVTQPSSRGNFLWVKAAGRAVEARLENRWRGAPGPAALSGVITLSPNNEYECLVLTPIGTDSCRIWLSYAGQASLPSFKGLLQSLVARLPVSVRSRISYKFWRWLGFPKVEPSSHWNEIEAEFVLGPADSA